MADSLNTKILFFFFLPALFIVLSPNVRAQHKMHNMGADTVNGKASWRMPPMNMEMPMMPGLGNELPPVQPFLPGMGLNIDDIPEAVPRKVMNLSDGDSLTLNATIVRRTINGKDFIMYGYNGQYPGPMLKVKTGATVHVNFNNEIEFPTTVHWHGLRLDNRFDGIPNVTQKPVKIGESFQYEVYFPDTGIYWYHPHVLEFIQQDLGLYGNMLVQPNREDYYSPVNHEQALILDDILIDDNGMLAYGKDAPTHALMGRFGNLMLVNGKTDYDLEVNKNDVIRFYVTNVANTRTFNMVFNGAKVKVVGSDVSKFEHEEYVQNVPIAVAERYIVEVIYDEPGSYPITNTIQAINHFRGEFYPKVDTLGMIHVSEEESDDSHVEEFNTLRENEDVQKDIAQYEGYFNKPVDHRIDMTLSVDGLPLAIMQSMEIDTMYVPHIEWNDSMPMMNWLSTGKQVKWILFDPEAQKQNMDISWEFDKGDVVKLRVFNDPNSFHPMNHPFHIHGQRFLVLSIDDVPNSNLVWKDTATIPVGSTVDLLVDMSNPGDWMMHCHIAEHLESGMMFIFTVNE